MTMRIINSIGYKAKIVMAATFLIIILFWFFSSPDTELAQPTNPVHEKYPGAFHPVPSYFLKLTPNGDIIDSSLPGYRIVVEAEQLVQDVTVDSFVELQVTPTLINTAEEVTLSWTSTVSPTDWIALYCPVHSDINKYIDYILPKDFPQNSAHLQLYNLRSDCQFRYYSNEANKVRLIARSNIIRFKGGDRAPLHGHLALTGNPNEMRVQWTSGTNETSIVVYGTDPYKLASRSIGGCTTYKAADMCGKPARADINFIHPGYFHDVLLTDLIPNTLYYYQYGSTEVMSEVHSFVASPRIGDQGTFTFLTYGDMGISTGTGLPAAQATAQLALNDIRDNGVRFIIHQGDLSYAVGYSYLWDVWMNLVEPLATRVPYMIGIGNHEQDYMSHRKGIRDPSGDKADGFHPPWGNYGHDSGGECGVPVLHRFHMPDNGNKIWWYSFKYGAAHFVFMSTEHNFTTGTNQYKWLERDMRSVDRSVTPWLIFVGHRPMYTSEMHPKDHKVANHIQEGLEDLLYKYNVDLALWGHYHSYERTCRVYRNQCSPKGTRHIVIGSAGIDLDSIPQYDVEWSEHLEMNYGYGCVTVANGSALLWQFIRNIDGTVADSVWMYK